MTSSTESPKDFIPHNRNLQPVQPDVRQKGKFPQRKFIVLQALSWALFTGEHNEASASREYFLEQFILYELTPRGFWMFGKTISNGRCEICFETGPCYEAFWIALPDDDCSEVQDEC